MTVLTNMNLAILVGLHALSCVTKVAWRRLVYNFASVVSGLRVLRVVFAVRCSSLNFVVL